MKKFWNGAAFYLMWISILLFLGAGFQIPRAYIASRQYDLHTVGYATKVSFQSDGEGKNRHWDVYIDYEAEGSTYWVVHTEDDGNSPREGDSYTVWYQSGNPGKCYVAENPSEALESYAIYTGMGLTGAVVFCLIRRFLTGKPERRKEENADV